MVFRLWSTRISLIPKLAISVFESGNFVFHACELQKAVWPGCPDVRTEAGGCRQEKARLRPGAALCRPRFERHGAELSRARAASQAPPVTCVGYTGLAQAGFTRIIRLAPEAICSAWKIIPVIATLPPDFA
jgi:hypothetical protein